MSFAVKPSRRLQNVGFCEFLGSFLDSLFRGNDGVEIGNGEKFAKGRISGERSRACARRTLTLALSHKGRGDPLSVICT